MGDKTCGRALLVQIGNTISPPAWATSTAYIPGDFVTEDGNTYMCREFHTSGTFSTDFANGNWELATDPVEYETVAGGRSDSISINGEQVDVTDKGSNDWRDLLANCGIRTVDISFSGLMTNAATTRAVRDTCLARQNRRFKVVDGFGTVYVGRFQVRNFETSGDHNDAQQASFSLESTGEILIRDTP